MLFEALLGIHILVSLSCVVSGPVAMLSKKRAGRHPRFGTIYYAALCLVFLSATGLSAMRWSQDHVLFLLGTIAFGLGSLGFAARRMRWRGWLSAHICGMGLSYVVLLTAFYVDNGPNLPVWQLLPHIAYWLIPSAVGAPLVFRALVRRRGGVIGSEALTRSVPGLAPRSRPPVAMQRRR